ncbi:MAG: hypothetical protein U1E56_02290 [Bauldia sp.]
MPASATPVPLPSPWGGMNTREGLASLQPNEARYLENWQPAGNALSPRAGYLTASSGGVGAAVETLAAYEGLTATALIGVKGGSVYDFSGASATLLSAADHASSRFQTECYNGRLIAVNGTDTPWSFDGASVDATGFTGAGLTLSRLANIRQVRNRLWFCEKDQADVWYGDIGAITGALTKFQLSQIAAGGTCLAIGAHSTADAGSGPGDYTVFVMNTGEVIVYSGDPSTTFAIVGKYRVPPPLGRQCLVKIGAGLAVITRMGLVPVTAAVAGTAFDPLATGAFGKVAPSLQADAASYGSLDGWSATFFDGLVIVNVPILDRQASRQYVFNSLVGAWTIWSGLDAAAFCPFGSALHWGAWAGGNVNVQAGPDDNGTAIALKARQAFLQPGGGHLVEATAVRFDMAVAGQVTGAFGIDVDYVARPITIPPVSIAQSFASTLWGAAWGSPWSSSNQYKGQWFSTYGLGRALGLALEATATTRNLAWYGSSVLVKGGGIT